jgi:predicted acetyltransferase
MKIFFFKQLPDRYAISQIKKNGPAIQFWKNVYKSLDIEFYEKEEKEEGHEVIYQYFKF